MNTDLHYASVLHGCIKLLFYQQLLGSVTKHTNTNAVGIHSLFFCNYMEVVLNAA